MQEGEEYLGGTTTMLLSRRWHDTSYGVYATNKRIIGIGGKLGLAVVVGGALGGAVGAVAASVIAGRKRSEDVEIIKELEKKKDFEITGSEISEIELKKHGLVGAGHILIVPKSGEPTKIKMGRGKILHVMEELMEAFCQQNPTVRLRKLS